MHAPILDRWPAWASTLLVVGLMVIFAGLRARPPAPAPADAPASAFVGQHPRASDVAVVVNVEARGTSG
jgi:hypothetical protein